MALTQFSSRLQFPGPPWVTDRQELGGRSCRPCDRLRYTWAEEGGGLSALRDQAMNKHSQREYRKIGFYRRL